MSVHVLVDDLKGDPDEYYKLVVDAVNKRELEIVFDWSTELETLKLFGKSGGARALTVTFKKQTVNVLGLPFGSSFVVTTRTTTYALDKHAQYLHAALMAAFEEVVDRAAREALVAYLEAQEAPVPAGLTPEAVFFTPSV